MEERPSVNNNDMANATHMSRSGIDEQPGCATSASTPKGRLSPPMVACFRSSAICVQLGQRLDMPRGERKVERKSVDLRRAGQEAAFDILTNKRLMSAVIACAFK